VLELGAGTGAVGIFAAALGAARVVLTDGGSDALLALAERNVELNRQPRGPVPASAVVNVERLKWGGTLHAALHSVDFVLASDVTTLRTELQVLCDTISSLIRKNPSTRVILSHECRSDYDEQLEYFEN